MTDSTALARKAVRAALEVRRQLGIDRSAPLCVFDLAERLGIEVKFRPEKSLDGMYFKLDPPVILISAHRPPGRQSYTCAHEIGHHVLGHGTRVDKYAEDTNDRANNDAEERPADFFAANLLMPPAAVRQAFESRGWTPACCDPVQILSVATYLGVGYETLVIQMRTTLGLINYDRAKILLKTTPKQIRRTVLGDDCCQHLVMADRAWDGGAVAIDLFTTDMVVLPRGIEVEGANIRVEGEITSGIVAIARRQGISRVQTADGQWNAYVRVSRRIDRQCTYVGRSIFRHDEDPDADECPHTD